MQIELGNLLLLIGPCIAGLRLAGQQDHTITADNGPPHVLLPIRASISLEYSQHRAKRQDVTKAIERGRVQARSTAPVEKQSVRAIQPVTE